MAGGGRRRLRRVLIYVVVGAVVLAGGVVAVLGVTWSRAAVNTAGEVEFEDPLAIPPLAPSEVDQDGRRVFDLTAEAGSHDFGRGSPTPTWGFDGDYLGPTLRAGRGEEVVVNVDNQLDEATSVHWHGMHLPAEMDGGPHQPVEPGETWSPTWQIDQPAATLWYHPHPQARPSSTSTAGWRACSSSTTRRARGWTCRVSTGWTTSR